MYRLTFISLIACLVFPAAASAGAPVYTETEILMGTIVKISVPASEAGQTSLKEAVQSAFREMRRLEAIMVKPKKPYDKHLAAVIRRAEEVRRETGGAFNIYYQKGRMDLGGIAKGYIVDEGISVLKQRGIRRAIIEAGGDLYCLGGKTDSTMWAVGLRDPRRRGALIGKIYLRDKAIATSGLYERGPHIIDPRTKKPAANSLLSISVVADTCMTADAFATGFFVMGRQRTQEFVKRHGGIDVILIWQDQGGIHTDITEGIRDSVTLQP